jgi:hypothetical protein
VGSPSRNVEDALEVRDRQVMIHLGFVVFIRGRPEHVVNVAADVLKLDVGDREEAHCVVSLRCDNPAAL